ncbi:MAG: hypothetical protein AAF311_02670 [Pseudomonadota bacterium]
MKLVKVIIAVAALLGLAAGAGYALWLKPQLEFAAVATAFSAKKVCSCLHVAGLSMEACEADFTDDVSIVEFRAEGDSVTAEVLGGRVSALARHRPAYGCQLVPN